MNSNIERQIKEIAVKKIPEESCGLIISFKGDLLCFECKNLAENKNTSFEMDPKDYLKASSLGEIIGMFHSQPNDLNDGAGQLDILNSKRHNILSIIYSWKSNSFFVINPKKTELNKYFQIPFERGINDCFTLVRKFYQEELKININNYDTEDNLNIAANNYKKEGFQNIPIQQMKIHDIIVFGIGDSEHLGIYMGDNVFLHHPRDRYSTVEFLSAVWSKRIKMVLRYKNKE